MTKPPITITVHAPDAAIRTMALGHCRELHSADPCDEPCDACWQAAERKIAEVNEQLARDWSSK
jgi:hypothetical protein